MASSPYLTMSQRILQGSLLLEGVEGQLMFSHRSWAVRVDGGSGDHEQGKSGSTPSRARDSLDLAHLPDVFGFC